MLPQSPCFDFLLDFARDLDVAMSFGPMPKGTGTWLRVALPTRTVECWGMTAETAAQRLIELEFPYLADVLSPPAAA